MLEGLFAENEVGVGGQTGTGGVHLTAGDAPPAPRPTVHLCGLYNQGATCYMNSLLQTLLMTPEFRETLFSINPEELGKLEDKGKPNARVRVIPIQLQRLFSQLLLLNQQSASTADLTDSFGWSNNEAFQQHDAQELNRILFCAIEDSLIGTTGHDIIRKLYHGVIVNQISCEVCGKISEREEDFLDLTMTVAGNSNLEESLCNAYVDQEMMDGKNQYQCEQCNKLVNAKKGAKLRTLPDILTVSLLRFSFDFTKMERYKETGKFAFPLSLDMAAYSDQVLGDTEYELFSVLVHRGSTHGGHYFAYIRDVDGLGRWTHPEEEEICVQTDPATGVVDYIEYDSPIELVQAILVKQGNDGMPIDKLGAVLTKQTGVSWNKRFKKQYGPLNKFLKKYDDKFVFNQASNWVSLKTYSNTETTPLLDVDHTTEQKNPNNPKNSRVRPRTPPIHGHCWFKFDDSRISPISQKEIEKQFSGKESAYMLFYRKKSMIRPPEAYENPSYSVPDEIYNWVTEENVKLQEKRLEYEVKVNTINVELHLSSGYSYKYGALQPNLESLVFVEHTLDRRKTVAELKKDVKQLVGDMVHDDFVIHTAKDLPAGLHLYQCISEDESATLLSFGIETQSKLFIWDGKQIEGHAISCGDHMEPILLNVQYGNPSQYSWGYPKTLTLGELQCQVAESIDISPDSFSMSRVITKGEDVCALALRTEDNGKTLQELKFNNGDQIVVEQEQLSSGNLVEKAVEEKSKLMSFVIENRCKECQKDSWPVSVVEVDKESTVEELKTVILSKLNIPAEECGYRLRMNDDDQGLRPPLHEQQSIQSAGLQQGVRLVIERGQPPTDSQMTITFSAPSKTKEELMIDKTATVQECLLRVISLSGFESDDYHLRRTNWCGESAAILDDLDLTLEGSNLKDGDHLLLEDGKLPPKGFFKLAVMLLPSRNPLGQVEEDKDPGMIAWLTSGLQGLLKSSETVTEPSPLSYTDTVSAGDLVISKQATLEDLKQQLLTLPLLTQLPIPSTDFIRVRVLEKGRPAVVLRGNTQSLQRLKLSNDMKLGVQVLPQEEHLNSNQIVLNVQLRVAETHNYLPNQELIWDTSKGLDAGNLRTAAASMYSIPSNRVMIAKHFPDKYEWMILSESKMTKQHGGRKGHKKMKQNLRNPPFHLKDGDTIGVKDMQFDPYNKDNFSTEDDKKGLEQLQKEAEERKQKREANKRQNAEFDIGGGGDRNTKRQEPTLSIKVADFR